MKGRSEFGEGIFYVCQMKRIQGDCGNDHQIQVGKRFEIAAVDTGAKGPNLIIGEIFPENIHDFLQVAGIDIHIRRDSVY